MSTPVLIIILLLCVCVWILADVINRKYGEKSSNQKSGFEGVIGALIFFFLILPLIVRCMDEHH